MSWVKLGKSNEVVQRHKLINLLATIYVQNLGGDADVLANTILQGKKLFVERIKAGFAETLPDITTSEAEHMWQIVNEMADLKHLRKEGTFRVN